MKFNKKCIIGILIIIFGIVLMVFSVLNMMDAVDSYNRLVELKNSSKIASLIGSLSNVTETSADLATSTIRVIIGEMISAAAFMIIGIYQLIISMKNKN